jgi:hypothetical protein
MAMFSAGWLLGMLVVALRLPTTSLTSALGLDSTPVRIYAPALHPLLIAVFQLLAMLTAWTWLDRSDRATSASESSSTPPLTVFRPTED